MSASRPEVRTILAKIEMANGNPMRGTDFAGTFEEMTFIIDNGLIKSKKIDHSSVTHNSRHVHKLTIAGINYQKNNSTTAAPTSSHSPRRRR